jgi:hypothetical protein
VVHAVTFSARDPNIEAIGERRVNPERIPRDVRFRGVNLAADSDQKSVLVALHDHETIAGRSVGGGPKLLFLFQRQVVSPFML